MVEQDDTSTKATTGVGQAAGRATKTTTATAKAPASAGSGSGPQDGGEWNRATHGQPPSERYAVGDF